MVNSISEKTNGECVLSNNKGRLKDYNLIKSEIGMRTAENSKGT